MVAYSFIQPDSLHGNVAEVIPNQLYFTSFTYSPKCTAHVRYIYLDDRVHYEPFYTDFGPLNLSVLYRFTDYLHSLLQKNTKRKIVVYTSDDEQNRVNGAFIMGSYLIIYHGMSADSAYLRLQEARPPKYTGFRDAAMGEPTYLLHLHDVLRGVEKALLLKWLNFANFDAEEYEYYERVENGDLNWIIPNKILSFCGPHNESRVEDGYPYHAPDTYFDFFRENNVTTIVRLNMRMYDAKKFVDAGFDHVDLFFIDGSTPSDDIVDKFIEVVDRAKGGVAVHCKAGLGRTGTLIACWMMKEYGLTAAECMAWLRVCRPGSVIGPQQQWLVRKQKYCWSKSVSNVVHLPNKSRMNGGSEKTFRKLTTQVHDIRLSRASPSNGLHVISENARPAGSTKRSQEDDNGNPVNEEMSLDSRGRSQGDRLLAMKARSQHAPSCSSTSSPSTTRMSSERTMHTHSTKPPARERSHNPIFPQMDRPSVLSRSSAAAQMSSSPRFSSPTTPIKPMSSPGTPVSTRPHTAVRNLSALVPPPIAKVTVASGSSRSVAGKPGLTRLSPGRRQNSSSRVRPYPSQGARVELAATPGSSPYDLRSRISPHGLSLPEAALSLPANTDALLGTRRKKRIS